MSIPLSPLRRLSCVLWSNETGTEERKKNISLASSEKRQKAEAALQYMDLPS